MEKTDPRISKVKALIAFRTFFVTVLLGSFALFEIGNGAFPYPKAVFNLIEALYGLTIIYALLLRRVKPKPFAYFQIVLDVIAALALIYFTGGIESWFSFLLILIVIASGTVIDKRAAFVAASLSSILYGAMLDLQYWRMIPIPYGLVLYEKDFLYNIFSNIVALYVCAYLTGQLSSSLERTSLTLEKRLTDFRKLSVFNREVVENMPSGLMTTDADGRILSLNRAGETITGLDRAVESDIRIQSIFPFIKDLNKPFERGEGEMAAGPVKKTIGLTISAMKTPQGDPFGYICIFSDLTEIKKMQQEMQLRQKWAAIGELSANIAHEIRNPLASLRGAVEMLHRGGTSPQQQESLMQMVLSEADRLNRIITDFLMYSRPSENEPEPVELDILLKGTLEMLGKSAPTGVRINSDIEPLRVTADPGRLQQVFYNLVLNAFEAMSAKGAGGGVLAVSGKKENGVVKINFADTGQGIDAKDAEKVFFPFFTTKDTGTGLGLSIAMRIMESHGGNIRFKSEPGQGTEFIVTLPINGKAPGHV